MTLLIERNGACLTYTATVTRETTPPRCRTPRHVERTLTGQVPVRVVTSQEAPVVLEVVTTDPNGSQDRKAYRGLDGVLLTPNDPRWAFSEVETYDIPSEDAFRDAIRAAAAGVVLIDGEPWLPTPEPVYAVMTFGLGGNHGGTCLAVRTATDEDLPWPATLFADAVARAREVALKRGDTESIDGLGDPYERMVVHDATYVLTPDPREVESERRALAVADLHSLARRLLTLDASTPLDYDDALALSHRLTGAANGLMSLAD